MRGIHIKQVLLSLAQGYICSAIYKDLTHYSSDSLQDISVQNELQKDI